MPGSITFDVNGVFAACVRRAATVLRLPITDLNADGMFRVEVKDSIDAMNLGEISGTYFKTTAERLGISVGTVQGAEKL